MSEIEFRCAACGEYVEIYNTPKGYLEVEPCKTCLEDAETEGYKEAEKEFA